MQIWLQGNENGDTAHIIAQNLFMTITIFVKNQSLGKYFNCHTPLNWACTKAQNCLAKFLVSSYFQ